MHERRRREILLGTALAFEAVLGKEDALQLALKRKEAACVPIVSAGLHCWTPTVLAVY